MSKDYEQKRIWFKKGYRFTLIVDKDPDGKESKLHLEKFKTRLCLDCSEPILDDGEIIGYEGPLIKVKPRGRKKELCDVCEDERIQKRDRERRKREREQVKQQDRSDCKDFAKCLKELPYKTGQEMQEKQCFDCGGYERP